jgi:hypothetical protein
LKLPFKASTILFGNLAVSDINEYKNQPKVAVVEYDLKKVRDRDLNEYRISMDVYLFSKRLWHDLNVVVRINTTDEHLEKWQKKKKVHNIVREASAG